MIITAELQCMEVKRKSFGRPTARIPTQTAEPPTPAPAAPHWGGLLPLAFRFSLLYLGIFCLATQISGSLFPIPGVSFRGLGLLWPMRPITYWIAAHVFGITGLLTYERNSGETAFFWVQTFWLLVVSV